MAINTVPKSTLRGAIISTLGFSLESTVINSVDDYTFGGFGVEAFTPEDLFKSGEQGVWFDFYDDMDTKIAWGVANPGFTSAQFLAQFPNHVLFQDSAGTVPVTNVEQPLGLVLDKSKGLVLGAENLQNSGNPFTATTNWTVQATGVLTLDAGRLKVVQEAAWTDGIYGTGQDCQLGEFFKYTVTVDIGTASLVQIQVGTTFNNSGAGELNITASGTYTFYGIATGTVIGMTVKSSTAATFYVSSASIKKLYGNHLIQATAAARPVLSARKNWLLATNALATQNVTSTAATYTISQTGTGTITLSGTGTGSLVGAGSLTFVATAGTLTLTVTGSVTNAQLEYGPSATTYQRVNTSTDYDTMGFPFYARFDGIDDGMATAASVDMSSTDKLAVFVGDANGNITNTGTLIESSPIYLNNSGSFALLVPSLSTSRGSFGSNGGLGGGEKEIQEPPIGQYRKRVITAYNDFATADDYGCDYIRTNGIPLAGLVGAGNTSVGAGPYGNHTFYTGSRNNTSNRFKGHVHQMIVLGREPTQEDLDNTEGFIFERQWGTPPEPSVWEPSAMFTNGEQGVW